MKIRKLPEAVLCDFAQKLDLKTSTNQPDATALTQKAIYLLTSKKYQKNVENGKSGGLKILHIQRKWFIRFGNMKSLNKQICFHGTSTKQKIWTLSRYLAPVPPAGLPVCSLGEALAHYIRTWPEGGCGVIKCVSGPLTWFYLSGF